MKLFLLGSGTLLPDPDRGAPGYWVELGGARILIDCGSGTLGRLARLGRDWTQVSHLVLSHFHLDHVADIGPLLFALKHGLDCPRTEPLVVLGPSGTQDHLNALAGAHGEFVLDPGCPLPVVELSPGEPWEEPGRTFTLNPYATNHTDRSLAFKLSGPDATLAYTGDTGPDPALGTFLAGSQIMVAECSNPDGLARGNHLTPTSLAEMALEARPELLVTVHAYPPLRPEGVPELIRALGYRGRIVAGRDGLVVTIEDGRVEVTGASS